MCSRHALWCFSVSPQCFRTARCSLWASTGHTFSEGHNRWMILNQWNTSMSGTQCRVFFILSLCEWWKWTYSPLLHQVCDHNDDSSVLLPHHPPKVFKRRLERPLCSNISSGPVVALKQESGGVLFTDKFKDDIYITYINIYKSINNFYISIIFY